MGLPSEFGLEFGRRVAGTSEPRWDTQGVTEPAHVIQRPPHAEKSTASVEVSVSLPSPPCERVSPTHQPNQHSPTSVQPRCAEIALKCKRVPCTTRRPSGMFFISRLRKLGPHRNGLRAGISLTHQLLRDCQSIPACFVHGW